MIAGIKLNKDNISICGQRFVLQSFSMELVTPEYLGWLKDNQINRYLINAQGDITLEDAGQYCQRLANSKNDLFLSILEITTGEHIGNVRLGPIDFTSRVCKFSMMIGKKNYHCQGLGTEIVSACIKYCFSNLKMKKFYLEVIEGNRPAVRVYEKNGLVVEGKLRNHLKVNDTTHNILIMSIFNDAVNQ